MASRLPAAERRSQLLDAALEVFSHDGYHRTSMNDVANAAGVTKPVLYKHFASKVDLYLELLHEVGARLDTAVVDAAADPQHPREKVLKGLTAYFTFVRDHRAEFRLIFGNGAENDPEFTGAIRGIEWTISASIAEMLADVAEPAVASRLAHGIVGMAEGTCRHWLSTEPDVDPAELSTDLADLLWNGLRDLSGGPADS